MIIVRAALETDIPQILKIEHEAISPPWTHGALLGEIYNENSFFTLAVEDDNVLGFVILRCSEEESQLLQIAVETQNRRRGIADMLMDAVCRRAASMPPMKVLLEVRAGNAAAINLYKKHGFVSVAVRKNYYTHPVEDAAVMMREM